MSVGCSNQNNKTLHFTNRYSISVDDMGFEESNRYTIAVKSINLAGASRETSNNVTTMTQETGENIVAPLLTNL